MRFDSLTTHEFVPTSENDKAGVDKPVSATDAAKESSLSDESSDLELTGGSKSTETGVRVEVDEHDDEEFSD